jgi:hypothetical protein
MTLYRVRSCPNCQYYVGYTVTKTRETPEASVKSFCLNCNYRLPVRAVLRGEKNAPPRRSRRATAGALRRAHDFHGAATLTAPSPAQGGESLTPPANYPRDLRVIGQELEKRRFTTFNLKCSDDAYFVWSTEMMAPSHMSDLESVVGESSARHRYTKQDDPAMEMLIDRIVGFQFDADKVKRLEREGVRNRRCDGSSDGRRLSHLLRTVGEQVYLRKQRLLAIAWQEHQIGVVAETATGRREINILRSDNLYDLWVRMYLQRSR